MNQQLTAGKTANPFEEEEKRRAELVRKALDENRMISFRWHGDGSGCEFYYKGIDHHGLPCTFLSSLDVANSIYVLSGKRVELQKGGAK